VKKTVAILVAALMISASGCRKTEETGKTVAPPAAAPAAAPQAAPQAAVPQTTPPAAPSAAAPQKPVNAPSGSGDPHAGLKLKEMPPGTGHKGKVLQIIDAGSYTYLEVEEKGQKFWIAALKAKVSKGDTVEFPDSKPMENFESKTLKRTFDKIIFAEGIRVVK
jgi:hypothetical protein